MDEYQGALKLWQSYHIRSAADLDKNLDSFRILFAFHSGKIENEDKKHDYVTGLYEVGSAVEDVESDLMELINEINEYGGNDVLQAASYLHAKFEFIHPFADGNGRVGRTLLNYYLMINNHPPLIVYDEDKRLYYESLQKYDKDEDLSALNGFFKYQIEKTWEKSMAIAYHVKQERKGLSDFT